jgi:hypothetical protein
MPRLSLLACPGMTANKSRVDCIARLGELRCEFGKKSRELVMHDTFAAQQWARLSTDFKQLMLIWSGVQGDTNAQALQRWHVFTPAEREAITLKMRTARRELDSAKALLL